jgi:SAM-dependent methyltransferase
MLLIQLEKDFKMNVTVRQSCRLCGSTALKPVLDLGEQFLATFFISKENESRRPTRKVPLELVRCNPEDDEDSCGLVQLKHTYPAELMYAEYWYLSGVNQTMRDALLDISTSICKVAELKAGDTVIDIGCNDGTLLKSYPVEGLDKIGFDPAQNVALQFAGEPFERVVDFFNSDAFFSRRSDKKAMAVTSIAMFYDLDDPAEFVGNISEVLDDEGVWILQMADLPNMLENNMFDNICHEHLCYYHYAPMKYLFDMHGLKIIDVEMNDINGSSYRFYIGKNSRKTPISEDAQKRIAALQTKEFNEAYDTDAPYERFTKQIEKNKEELIGFLTKAKSDGKKVFVYGASTKGNVLLQYFGITADLVPFALERNEKKWGLKTLGSDIPIISEEEGRAMNPDYLLVLPYHFMNEMLKRETEFTDRGGKFIVPVPTIHLLP